MLACVCICMCVGARGFVCMSMWRPEDHLWFVPQATCAYCFWDSVFYWPGSGQVGQAGRQVVSRDLLVSTSPELGIQEISLLIFFPPTMLSFCYVGFSGLCSMGMSLQPAFMFLWFPLFFCLLLQNLDFGWPTKTDLSFILLLMTKWHSDSQMILKADKFRSVITMLYLQYRSLYLWPLKLKTVYRPWWQMIDYQSGGWLAREIEIYSES